MIRNAEIILEFPIAGNVECTFDSGIEVSLDCSHCRRTGRTVVFRMGRSTARCIHRIPEENIYRSKEEYGDREGRIYGPSAIDTDPHRKPVVDTHPPFPGRIVEMKIGRDDSGAITGAYHLEYEASPFEDAKYGPKRRPWTGYPTWARAYFVLTCPECATEYDGSVQNNSARPWTHACDCGFAFFTERRELPRLRWLNPETEEWVFVR